jgi:hypothetical protein
MIIQNQGYVYLCNKPQHKRVRQKARIILTFGLALKEQQWKRQLNSQNNIQNT